MLRLSSLSLCLLACGACDDAPVGDDPAPEPSELVCSEIVLENGRSAIARCPDGARFSWIVDGREVLKRVSSAVVIGGIQVEPDAWPTVIWGFDRSAEGPAKADIVHSGRPDLPTVGTFLTLTSDGLKIETTVQVESALFLDAVVVVTGGLDATGPTIGPDGFEASSNVVPREGAQVWLAPTLLSARASRPAMISGSGRVEVPVGAEASPFADFVVGVDWAIDRLEPGLRGGFTADDGEDTAAWGWRTGAAHGAIVDANVIATERAILTAIEEDPWIVVDGLWAPALGDWRIEPALRAATSGARLGLFWPAALVCPDALEFPETAQERLPSETACAQLNPLIPAARVRVLTAANSLESQGVDDVWLATTAFVDLVDLQPTRSFEASRNTSVDRFLGAPGEDCLYAALNGPFPRSAECEATLRTLDTPVAAPQVDPIEGAQTLMDHLDLGAVSPMPLTLTGPPGEARQRLVLTGLGGGHMLIADAPSAVSDDAWDWLAAVRSQPEAFLTYPRLTADDWPPSRWDGDTSRIVFNFTDAPKTVTLDPEWVGTTDLFDPQVEATVEVSIPPHDVRVFVRPAQ